MATDWAQFTPETSEKTDWSQFEAETPETLAPPKELGPAWPTQEGEPAPTEQSRFPTEVLQDVPWMTRFRMSPVGRTLLGPTAEEKAGMAGEASGSRVTPQEIVGKLLEATTPASALPGVAGVAEKIPLTPLAPILPTVAKAFGAGETAQKIAGLPEAVDQGVKGAALAMPLAPIPGLRTAAGRAALGAFATQFLASQPEQLAAFRDAMKRGDYTEAAKIIASDVATAVGLGLGGREALRPQARPPALPTPEETAIAKAEPILPQAAAAAKELEIGGLPAQITAEKLKSIAPTTQEPIPKALSAWRDSLTGKVFVGQWGDAHSDVARAVGRTFLTSDRIRKGEIEAGFVIPDGSFITEKQFDTGEKGWFQAYGGFGKFAPENIKHFYDPTRLESREATPQPGATPTEAPAAEPSIPTPELPAAPGAQVRPSQEPIREPTTPVEPVKTQAPAAQMQAEVSKVAATEGPRSAKDIKSELLTKLQEAIDAAPDETSIPAVHLARMDALKTGTDASHRVLAAELEKAKDAGKVTRVVIDIPGDGVFDAWNTKQNLELLLRRAKRISTSPNLGPKIKHTGTRREDVEWLESQRQQPMPEGPGALTAGTPPTGKAQIEQLTQAFQNIEGKKVSLADKIREAFDFGKARATAADAVSRAVSGLKHSGDYLIGAWKGVPNIDELLRAKGELSKSIESRGWRVKQFVEQSKRAVPSKAEQAAIAKYIDAGGDMAELQRGAAETKPQFRQTYLDAMNLKGDTLVAAQNAQNYFEARLKEAVDAGVLKEGIEDYIHRIYENRPKQAQAAIAYVQTGLLRAHPSLTRHRAFEFDWQAEKEGYRPVQSFITRIAQYEASLSKAIAARDFIRKATTMKAADGRPVIDVKGVGVPIEDPQGVRQATLIKPQFNPARANEPGTPNYRGDYVNKEFPALSKWKWVSADAAGKPIFVQGDVAIHPHYVGRITALLEPSRVRYGRYGAIGRPALNIGAAFKQTMLDFSGFHQVQITLHGMEHKVLPWKILQGIDFENPNVDGLLKGGLTLGGDYGAAYREGLVGASLSRRIPLLGPLMESYHSWLFQSYIPRIKMTMALAALERNRARYPGMTPEQLFHKTAYEGNAAFGELNYIMLERSKTAQDIMRLALLAPDFLEARARFAAEAFERGGKTKVPGWGNEQRAALLLGAMTMYITARILNKTLDGQYHFEPENAFSVVYKQHAYGLRTVQGDILHALTDPVKFMMNRLNPVYGRTLLELGTRRDSFGRTRSTPEILWDNASNIVPIAFRSGAERRLWESMAAAFGVNVRRYTAVDDAFKLARSWKAAQGIGERGEFIYDSEKDPLRQLKIALSHGEEGVAAGEIKKLIQSKAMTPEKLGQYFKRYAAMPFTGSRANDARWLKTLNADQLKTVTAATQYKREIQRLFIASYRQYLANRQPQSQ